MLIKVNVYKKSNKKCMLLMDIMDVLKNRITNLISRSQLLVSNTLIHVHPTFTLYVSNAHHFKNCDMLDIQLDAFQYQ